MKLRHIDKKDKELYREYEYKIAMELEKINKNIGSPGIILYVFKVKLKRKIIDYITQLKTEWMERK